jgi:hypothetical protein
MTEEVFHGKERNHARTKNVHAFGGNSGGPVLREPLPFRSDIEVWGLVTGGNLSGRDYALITPVERIQETIIYARDRSPADPTMWKKKPPSLPIRCTPDK